MAHELVSVTTTTTTVTIITVAIIAIIIAIATAIARFSQRIEGGCGFRGRGDGGGHFEAFCVHPQSRSVVVRGRHRCTVVGFEGSMVPVAI